MNKLKDIAELIKAGVITEETAVKIQDYYKGKSDSSPSWLFIVFGILGATLVGMGIILIIAHNWDELSRVVKTVIAFLPLVIGQAICGFVLIKKKDSIAWRESATAFLFFSVGACISLVSQIYNMPGNLSSFLLIWMILCLPLIYVMKSSTASLLYLIGITYYACETSYFSYPNLQSYFYWLLLFLALPHYFLLYKDKPQGNFIIFHNWLVPLSVVIALGTIAKDTSELMFIAYFSLFGVLYLIGHMDFFSSQKLRNNGYKIVGSLGTIILMLTLSFDGFWFELRNKEFHFNEIITSPELLISTVLSLSAVGLLYLHLKNKPIIDIKPLAPIFLIFILTYIFGLFLPISVVLMNFYVFALGILTMREGANQNHLGILNYGLLIITALVICRFFDANISFVLRGILFISIGAGFFAANYWMLQKRKTHE